MAPTPPVTLIRVKRPRNSTPFSSLRVNLPISKPRLSALSISKSANRYTSFDFHRLPSLSSLETLASPHVNVIDVEQKDLVLGKRGREDDDDKQSQEVSKRPRSVSSRGDLTCNGEVMNREVACDFFVKDTHRERLGLQPREQSKEDEKAVAEVNAERFTESDLVLITEVDDFYDEFETDDERSMDYPSTPESSSNGISEDDSESDDDDDGLHGRFLGYAQFEDEHPDNHETGNTPTNTACHSVRKRLRAREHQRLLEQQVADEDDHFDDEYLDHSNERVALNESQLFVDDDITSSKDSATPALSPQKFSWSFPKKQDTTSQSTEQAQTEATGENIDK